MFEITFGEIDAGWAQTWFDNGEERIEVRISYVCDPFHDLASLALRMTRLESPLEMRFTDEDYDFDLLLIRNDGTYRLRLECDGRSNYAEIREPLQLTAEIEPWEMATQLWRELSRVSRLPARGTGCQRRVLTRLSSGAFQKNNSGSLARHSSRRKVKRRQMAASNTHDDAPSRHSP